MTGMANVIYTVTDTGIGIKKENIPYLFTAFKRVDEERNKYIEGTGLGLSIVKQFVDLMGGKITVNSVYTKGFNIYYRDTSGRLRMRMLSENSVLKIRAALHEKKVITTALRHRRQGFLLWMIMSNLMVVTKLLRDTRLR